MSTASDSLREEDPAVDHIPDTEWTKITSEFTNTGYREGIIAGKDAFLQIGFDASFADVGAPLGRELGNLHGTAAAIGSFLASQTPGSRELEEVRSIASELSAIQLSDLKPRDLEAEQHAKEHPGLDTPTVVENSLSEMETGPQEGRATEEVSKLKERLALISAKIGLPVRPGHTL